MYLSAVFHRKFLLSSLLILLLILCASAHLAIGQPPVAAACGANDMMFNVRLSGLRHNLVQPENGKALLYFIQDIGLRSNPYDVTKVGLDGAWLGANQGNSYLFVSVSPGQHHLCIQAQAHYAPGKVIELAHFTAEAGNIYYFRIRNYLWQSASIQLEQLDSDEARFLIASDPQSIATPKP
jgi:hypothetical protein